MRHDRRTTLGMLTAAAGSVLLPGSSSSAQTPSAQAATAQPTANTPPREVVAGIGGFFFRAHDPKSLAQWYLDHLGINLIPSKHGDQPWQQQAGPTAFAPFPEKTGYFGDPAKQWMINFRVGDLDRLAAQLTAAGIPVKIDPQTYPNGRFAHLHDPEGNPVELWQPMDPQPASSTGSGS